MYLKIWFIYCSFTFIPCALIESADADMESTPCNSRKVEFGIVCVCNSTYCDYPSEMPTEVDQKKVIIYTSSESGQRLAYNTSEMTTTSTYNTLLWNLLVPDLNYQKLTLNINRNKKHQKILGFGGSFTDSASINIMSMSEAVQETILRAYFSEEGLQYNMGRVPIGGCDFSTRGYSLDDTSFDDVTLGNFSLAEEDNAYKIPLIKRAQNMSLNKMLLTSAVWSPPTWMKTNNNYVGGFLKTQFYDLYTSYIIKFSQKYKENGLEIWGVSTGNEPLTGLTGNLSKINSLAWTPSDQAYWIVNSFGPKIRNNADVNNTKILFLDDQRPAVSTWLPLMELAQCNVTNFMDGVALHWYLDVELTASVLDDLRKKIANKWIINTEASIGSVPLERKVELGSWYRCENYLTHLMSDMNHEVNGWIDWNLVLDLTGGPNWLGNYEDAFILVDSGKDEIYKQPMFYAFGHVSKFVPRDSYRIDATDSIFFNVPYIAFLRPDNYVTVIVLNNESTGKVLLIKDGDLRFQWNLEAHSITTMIYNPGVC